VVDVVVSVVGGGVVVVDPLVAASAGSWPPVEIRGTRRDVVVGWAVKVKTRTSSRIGLDHITSWVPRGRRGRRAMNFTR
jgi:hypothetical protein